MSTFSRFALALPLQCVCVCFHPNRRGFCLESDQNHFNFSTPFYCIDHKLHESRLLRPITIKTLTTFVCRSLSQSKTFCYSTKLLMKKCDFRLKRNEFFEINEKFHRKIASIRMHSYIKKIPCSSLCIWNWTAVFEESNPLRQIDLPKLRFSNCIMQSVPGIWKHLLQYCNNGLQLKLNLE